MRWLALGLLVGWAGATPSRFALVVGNNAPLSDSDYEPLQYADDDALRFARLMRRLGAQAEVLVAPDAETRERFPDVKGLVPPKRANVVAAIGRLEKALAEAPAPREVYVYFSGHGSVTGSDAYLHLLDAPFHRTDLYALVLDRLPRERMHVVIDSCHSYFLVNARGRVRAQPEQEDLSRYPDVGFLLSTSDRREVHEWAGYHGGVFSYQILGALHGAADIDEDGQVSYAEAHAYVVAANMAVQNPRARIRPFVRSPDGRGALVDLRSQPRATVPDTLVGRLRVRDRHGYPHLDAHKAAGPMSLMLPDQHATMEVGDQVYAVPPEEGTMYAFVATTQASPVASRGALDDDFRKNLFRRPLTQDFVDGFAAAAQDLSAPAPEPARSWLEDPLTVTLGATGVAGLVAGGVFTALYLDARDEADARPLTDASEAARERADRWQTGMWIAYAGGAALVTAAILNAAFDRTQQVSFSVSPEGVGLSGAF